MYTKYFARDLEIVRISEYGFEWYVGGELVRTGCVENIAEDIEALINMGFIEAR